MLEDSLKDLGYWIVRWRGRSKEQVRATVSRTRRARVTPYVPKTSAAFGTATAQPWVKPGNNGSYGPEPAKLDISPA
jgi:hypothetical protein